MSLIKSTEMLIVLTSFSHLSHAQEMARDLIGKRLAACIQIQEGVLSIYSWKGVVREDREVILSAKTVASKWNEICSYIKTHHPYDVPEVLALAPAQYDQQYGEWVEALVNSD